MTSPPPTHELARRCEEAGGPDRELDVLIYAETLGGGEWIGNMLRAAGVNLGFIDPGKHSRNFSLLYSGTPAYTASIDAALTLLMDGWDFGCGSPDATGKCWAWCGQRENPSSIQWDWMECGNAATPALALCAAALKARSRPAQGSEEGRG